MTHDGPGAPPHPPRTTEPVTPGTLGPGSVVRDAVSGEMSTYDAWLVACESTERRPRDECLEQLMNAIARGDLIVVDFGTQT